MKPEYQDKIDDYLMNRMTEEERRMFEMEVGEDSELKDQLSYSAEVKRLMIDRNEKLSAMKEWEEEYERDAKRNVARKRTLYWVSGVAAVFVVGLLVLNINRTTNVESITGNEGVEIPYPQGYGNLKGGGNYAEIQNLLEKKDNANAMELIEKEESEIETLLTESEMITDEKRRDYEKKRIKMYSDELQWLKVYALFGLDRNKEAMQLLDEIRNGNGAFQHLADSVYLARQ